MVVVQATGHTGNKWELTEISFLANSNKDQSSHADSKTKTQWQYLPKCYPFAAFH